MVLDERRKRPSWHSVIGTVLLLIVVTVLCIVFGMPNVQRREGNAKIAKAKSDLAVLAGAVDQFMLDCKRYPTNREGFSALQIPPDGVKGWRGPYLKEITDDPWGHPFRYRTPGENGKDGYLVESYGADGKPGGDGEDVAGMLLEMTEGEPALALGGLAQFAGQVLLLVVIDEGRLVGLQVQPDRRIRQILEVSDGGNGPGFQDGLDFPRLGRRLDDDQQGTPRAWL